MMSKILKKYNKIINTLRYSIFKQRKTTETITSVEEAIALMNELKISNIWSDTVIHALGTAPLPFPFGLWFRGQSNENWSLEPSIFRDGTISLLNNTTNKLYKDEVSMFHHFRLLNSSFAKTHHTTFEWLTLMQHYGVPTRLLDWSESILAALFFSVMNTHESDVDNGTIYILNGLRLNALSTFNQQPKLTLPNCLDVTIRAEMAKTNTISELSSKNAIVQHEELQNFKVDKFFDENIELLELPVAVTPMKLSPRLQAQSGCFTIHGGKKYFDLNQINDDENLGKAEKIEDINKKSKELFLMKIKIPVESKIKIKKELTYLGIHEGSLLVELPDQANFIKNHWTFFKNGKKDKNEPTDDKNSLQNDINKKKPT